MLKALSPRGMQLLTAAAQSLTLKEKQIEIILTALLSMVPMYEGRYAVPIMIRLGLPPVFTWLLAGLCSSVPMPVILLLLRPVLDWFYTLPIKPVRAFAAWLEKRSAWKAEGKGFPGNAGAVGPVYFCSPAAAGYRLLDGQRHCHIV